MMRRLFTLLSILSLLLCVAAGLMWSRSRSAWDTLYVRTGGEFWHFESALSRLTIQHFSGWPNPPAYHFRTFDPDPSSSVTPLFGMRIGGANRTEWRRCGFSGAHGTVCIMLRPDGAVDWDSPGLPALRSIATATFSAPFPFWSVMLPYWSVVTLFALLPTTTAAVRTARWLHARRRRSRGLCAECGYDLRASTGRCSECGTPIPDDAKAIQLRQ